MILGTWRGCLYCYRVEHCTAPTSISLWYGYWQYGRFHRVYCEKLIGYPDWLLHNDKYNGEWIQNRKNVLREFGYDY